MSESVVKYEVSTTYDLSAYHAIARAQTNLKGKRLVVGFLTTGFLFAMLFVYILIVGIHNILAVIPWLVVTGLLAGVMISKGWHYDRTIAKNLWKKNHKYIQTVNYQFYVDHMESDQPEIHLPYEDIYAIRETDEFYLIYVSEKAINVLSKNGFKKGNKDSFKTFITQVTGKEMEYFE